MNGQRLLHFELARPALRRCPERTAGRRRSRTGRAPTARRAGWRCPGCCAGLFQPRANRRYWMASATCGADVITAGQVGDGPRATFRMRCQARADRSSCALACVSSLAPAVSGWQLVDSRVVRRAFGLCWRAACRAWAASTGHAPWPTTRRQPCWPAHPAAVRALR